MANNKGETQSDFNVKDLSKILIENNVTPEKLQELINNANNSEKNVTLDKLALKKCCSDIELYCNKNEQYVRNWAIRIRGPSVPEDLVKRVGADEACMITAYNTVIEPVLRKLTPKPEDLDEDVKWGSEKLDCVPKVFDLLSNGHFVGKKQGDQPRTIIIRFLSRYMRNLFLRNKRHFMPKPTAAETTMGVKYYSAYPDLTVRNHSYLMALKRDTRVKAAWAFDGNIRFVLAETEHQDNSGEEETKSESSKVFFVDDLRIEPAAVINKAVASLLDDGSSRENHKDIPSNNRQLRSKVPGKGQGGPENQTSGRGGVRVGVPGGRGGVPGGRGGLPGGRGGLPGGRGGVSAGRGGQPGGRGRGSQGGQKASGGRGGASNHPQEDSQGWKEVANGAPKGEVDKKSGLLPTENDLACSSFNANSFDE
ncbi:MAG: hypothetical protein GY739_16765 [Mesoflavibacter sp.]|nr:hypothetical protein [Mesoflavibacter sp.]